MLGAMTRKKNKPPPPDVPIETEPTWAEIERVARRVLTTPPSQKGRVKTRRQPPKK